MSKSSWSLPASFKVSPRFNFITQLLFLVKPLITRRWFCSQREQSYHYSLPSLQSTVEHYYLHTEVTGQHKALGQQTEALMTLLGGKGKGFFRISCYPQGKDCSPLLYRAHRQKTFLEEILPLSSYFHIQICISIYLSGVRHVYILMDFQYVALFFYKFISKLKSKSFIFRYRHEFSRKLLCLKQALSFICAAETVADWVGRRTTLPSSQEA